MKKTMNQILLKIKNLEDRIKRIERNSIENKADKIFEYIDKMNDDELYEIANFILDLRNLKKPFSLEQILEGIKLIADKKINRIIIN